MLKAWLVRTSGPLAGTRYPVSDSVTLVGRGPQNDILIEDDAGVSITHLEIRKDGESYSVHDKDSTNGTYVNGVRTAKTILKPPFSIQLGQKVLLCAFVLCHSCPVHP